jgi:predicted ATPase
MDGSEPAADCHNRAFAVRVSSLEWGSAMVSSGLTDRLALLTYGGRIARLRAQKLH